MQEGTHGPIRHQTVDRTLPAVGLAQLPTVGDWGIRRGPCRCLSSRTEYVPVTRCALLEAKLALVWGASWKWRATFSGCQLKSRKGTTDYLCEVCVL